MKFQFYILTIISVFLTSYISAQTNAIKKNESTNSILKVEMSLSAFGVESDSFPSIDVFIDFEKDSTNCVKTFYNPAYKGSTYTLTKSEMESIIELLKNSDLEKLKKSYTTNITDQPSSKTVIQTNKAKYTINDYGLKGGYPLQELYKIIYKY